MTATDRPFSMTVVLSANAQTGGGYHQALTSLEKLLNHRPPNLRIRVLDARRTFGDGLNKIIQEGRLRAEDVDSVPERLPSFRDRVIVEKGLLFQFIRWVLSLRGMSVGASALARYLDNSDTDLVYFVTPSMVARELQVKPYIWTLWDLCHLDSPEFPEVRTSGKFEARDEATGISLRKAALVVVDSEELETNARQSYGITANKFVRISFSPPRGVLEKKAPKARLPEEIVNIRGNYVFYPAQLWTHKNHQRIAEAIAILKGRGHDIHAVFVGKDHGAGASLRRSIEALGVADNIHFLGYVDDEMVPELYRASLGLVMASYFGPTNIPPLEALLLDVPVIASSQHIEQLGDAAIFFNPDDAEELANAIESLSLPATRRKLAARGQALLAATDNQRSEGYRELSHRIELLAKRLLL